MNRRDALKMLTGAAGAALAGERQLGLARAASEPVSPAADSIFIDPTPRHELSPHLYMQFMEPLGATDGSVEASWDHRSNRWRPDLLEVTRDLSPTMVRWGGIFCDYYRWREGVGPRSKRVPMLNLLWGGIESNQIGTVEFVDFCRQVGADPLICVNFESDGRPKFMNFKGGSRTADAREAADWVAYCNDPNNKTRRQHGLHQPLNVPFWQIGNETSYARTGFPRDVAIEKTIEFAIAMRRADPGIQLIAWGDNGWAGPMVDRVGEHLQFVAFHHMFNPDRTDEPVLAQQNYRRDPAATWDVLMEAWKQHDQKIRTVRDSLSGRQFPLAMTECHFSIPGRDRCDVMSTWATGCSYGRLLNTNQRHGDVLKIATAADFAGNRWQVNAVMMTTPPSGSYLMPVARVMKLYRHHTGTQAVDVKRSPATLDVVASRSKDTIYCHVVNISRTRPAPVQLEVDGRTVRACKVYQIAENPTTEVDEFNSHVVMRTEEKTARSPTQWTFPPASVSALEIETS